MWACFNDSGLVTTAGSQQHDATAIQVPSPLDQLPVTQLRLVGGVIKDGATLSSFFINQGGVKCTMNPGGFQPLNCYWNDKLIRSRDGVWYVESTQAGQIVSLLRYATNTRYMKEIGGIAVNGMSVMTTRDSQQQITTAYQHANADPAFTWDWKSQDGKFYHLDAPGIIAMSDAVKAHVQDCFSTEKEVVDGINNGTITTTAQIDAAFGVTYAAGPSLAPPSIETQADPVGI